MMRQFAAAAQPWFLVYRKDLVPEIKDCRNVCYHESNSSLAPSLILKKKGSSRRKASGKKIQLK